MALNRSMEMYVDPKRRLRRAEAPPGWRFHYPNTADFNFDYWRLLDDAKQTAIGKNNDPNLRIAVVGCGAAGLTAARELFRCGFTHIDLYEASQRMGGRTYSIPAEGQQTCFEMGAMRMPYFSNPGDENSVLGYYTDLYQVGLQDFPNPGSSSAYNTGIYLNDGFGPSPKEGTPPELLIWDHNASEPPTPELKMVFAKWQRFAKLFTDHVGEIYDTEAWEPFWQQIVTWYWEMNFRELVFEAAISEYNPDKPGDFGGLGMTEEESELFYTIGAGDGAWGAFYDISCLYVMRTLLFGFGNNLKLIKGRFDGDTFLGGPQAGQPLEDSSGTPYDGPDYLGVETFADSMFYLPVESSEVDNISLYEAMRSNQYDVNLYVQNKVHGITRLQDGSIQVASDKATRTYDAVVLTPPTWATELSMGVDFRGFNFEQWPFNVRTSFKVSHWIRSCKVFYPLKERYWGEGKPIPQMISTDDLLQGVYGYAVGEDPGVLMVSYTWEDGASKFLAEPDSQALGKQLLAHLDDLLLRCQNIQTPISPYVDTEHATVIHWQLQPTYRGCAKLYRERSWNADYALLRYNQNQSRSSGLYFAGEAFSVEGGWTEPALRGGLDAVVHVIRNTGGTFLNGFDYEKDYPRYSTFEPERSPRRLVVI